MQYITSQMHKEEATAFVLSWFSPVSKNRLATFYWGVFFVIFFLILIKGYSYKDLNQDLKHQM